MINDQGSMGFCQVVKLEVVVVAVGLVDLAEAEAAAGVDVFCVGVVHEDIAVDGEGDVAGLFRQDDVGGFFFGEFFVELGLFEEDEAGVFAEVAGGGFAAEVGGVVAADA